MTKFIRAAVSLWEWLQILDKSYTAFIWERRTFEGWEIMRIKTQVKRLTLARMKVCKKNKIKNNNNKTH